MSRSRQAGLLARHLAEVTDVEVELYYDTGARWIAMWADGPLQEEMRAHLDTALAGHHYVDMRDRKIDCHRSNLATGLGRAGHRLPSGGHPGPCDRRWRGPPPVAGCGDDPPGRPGPDAHARVLRPIAARR
ncbi:hypothetical protein GCM10010284_68250 [Streptomyces rubiginosohelvolus]|nr:hypothetical protein GCM10010284_68250 [Streptomyces rubiginosohelvolus]